MTRIKFSDRVTRRKYFKARVGTEIQRTKSRIKRLCEGSNTTQLRKMQFITATAVPQRMPPAAVRRKTLTKKVSQFNEWTKTRPLCTGLIKASARIGKDINHSFRSLVRAFKLEDFIYGRRKTFRYELTWLLTACQLISRIPSTVYRFVRWMMRNIALNREQYRPAINRRCRELLASLLGKDWLRIVRIFIVLRAARKSRVSHVVTSIPSRSVPRPPPGRG